MLLPTGTMRDDARRIHNGLADKRPAVIAQYAGSADIARAVRLARERIEERRALDLRNQVHIRERRRIAKTEGAPLGIRGKNRLQRVEACAYPRRAPGVDAVAGDVD